MSSVEFDPALIPVHATLSTEVAAQGNAYAPLQTRYREAMTAIADIGLREAEEARPPHRDQQHRRAVTSWRLEGDISDGQFDSATQLIVVGEPAGKQEPPADALIPDRIRALPAANYRVAQELGKTGLYIVGVSWREVPLAPMQPREIPARPRPARFVNPEADLRYKASPETVALQQLAPLPTLEQLTAEAHSRYSFHVAEALITPDLRTSLQQAITADQATRNGDPDNLLLYRALREQLPEQDGLDVANGIRSLAAKLYELDPDNLDDRALIGVLLQPYAANLALLAAHNKGSYYLQTRSRKTDDLLVRRLHWLAETAPLFQKTYADAVLKAGPDPLAKELNVSTQRALDIVHTAETLREHLAPPQTVSLWTPVRWDVQL
ncbi:MAG TPA: hypothetical protein VLF91_03260 [Candidatus Saccharimonadales bacterium]|nr:hypothetical protein [Candidatus Saccharimonadales bacterium]